VNTHRAAAAAAVVLLAALAVSSCGGSGGGNDPSARTGATPANTTSGKLPSAPSAGQQELAYGRAPVPGAVKYQPDVVLVGGGAAMVRGVSGDSLTWSIDARAPHLDELQPGKIMFLTGRAVGRVLDVEKAGAVVKVTLGPVDVTDVIADGDVEVNEPLDASAMSFQTFPDVPGVDESSSGTASPTTSPTPSKFLAGLAQDRAHMLAPRANEPLPPPSTGSSVEVSAGDWSAEVGRKVSGGSTEFSLKTGYKVKGVTVGLEFTATMAAPTVKASLGFSGGALTRNEFSLDGLKNIKVSLISGTETGLSGNFKSRIEVPVEANFPLPAGPVPFIVSVRFKFLVETAFSARNATLTANGELKVDGPIGFSGTNVFVPSVNPTTSPIDNMAGVSVGVNAVVFAMQLKVVVGLGIPAALAGPFGAVTVSYGLTNGSAIGIIQCRQASLDVVVGYGAGYTLSPGESKFLELLKVKLPWAPKIDSELAASTKSVLHKIDVKPKVAACGG
jgi:hypothetical protein